MLSTFAYEAAGAPSARHSLRPLLCWAEELASLGRPAPREREDLSQIRASLPARNFGCSGMMKHRLRGLPPHRHRPPPGLAFGESDDRLLRAIQYSQVA